MSSKNVLQVNVLLALLLLALCACHSSCAEDESQQTQSVETVEAGPVLGAPRPIPRMRPGQRAIGIIAPPNATGSVAPPDNAPSAGP